MATAPHNDRQAKIAAASREGGSNVGKLIAGLVVALLVIGGIIYAVTRNSDNGPQNLATNTSSPSASGTATSSTSSMKLPKGVKDATSPLVATNGGVIKDGIPTLAVFEDFQCPICKQAEDSFGARIRSLGDQGKINVAYYPEHFLDRNLKNDSSSRAANAAMCAADAGKFNLFHDKLFAKQPTKEGEGYTDEVLKATATEAGITGPAMDTFTKCMGDKTYMDYLKSVDDWTFNTAKLTGTPTFFVNNKLFTIDPKTPADEFEKQLFAAAK